MFRIGTRGSTLATTQTGHVAAELGVRGYTTEITRITTKGDVNMSPVERIGVGVFTQALRDALQNNVCDIAVHSFKDLPTAVDERFVFVTPPREDHREALVARDGLSLADLPSGSRVGTSAPRRVSQLRGKRADLDIRPLRGNIDSRMNRVATGELDAVMLAAAGLSRVAQLDKATQLFDDADFLPAPAQGALAVECRCDDAGVVRAVLQLNCLRTYLAATAERAVLSTLEAGCTAPVGAYAQLVDGVLHLEAGVFAVDGSAQLRRRGERAVPEALDVDAPASLDQLAAASQFAEALGNSVARELLDAGAAELMVD